MFALDAASRAALAAFAFAAFGAAFVTTPIVARSDGGVIAVPTPSVVALPASAATADVVPRRDPFAGGDGPPVRTDAAAPQGPSAVPPVPAMPQIPAALRALPPNAGAADTAFPFATGARSGVTVTAVITGPRPFALVDESGTTHVLTVGDRIDGDLIVAIGADGVRLSGGTMLAVARASETVSLPAPARAVAPVLALPPHPRAISGGR